LWVYKLFNLKFQKRTNLIVSILKSFFHGFYVFTGFSDLNSRRGFSILRVSFRHFEAYKLFALKFQKRAVSIISI
jgi:hypothetical protein